MHVCTMYMKARLKYPYFSLPVFLVVMMLMLMMMVMTVHNFTPWWMLTPAAINFTPHAWKTADVSLSPALPSSSSNRLHHNRTTLYRTTGGFIALVPSTNRLNPHSYQHQCDWILQAGPTGGFHSPGRSIKSKIRIANHLTASHLIIIKNTLLSLLWSKPAVSCLQNKYFFGKRNFDKKQMIPEAHILVLMGSLADDRGEILPP